MRSLTFQVAQEMGTGQRHDNHNLSKASRLVIRPSTPASNFALPSLFLSLIHKCALIATPPSAKSGSVEQTGGESGNKGHYEAGLRLTGKRA